MRKILLNQPKQNIFYYWRIDMERYRNQCIIIILKTIKYLKQSNKYIVYQNYLPLRIFKISVKN